jgi:hypothetical protein
MGFGYIMCLSPNTVVLLDVARYIGEMLQIVTRSNWKCGTDVHWHKWGYDA